MNPTVVGQLTGRRKAIILFSCCLSLLIVSMDATIVNVALPTLRTDLHASASQLQWVIDVYTLVLASLLLLSGAVADRFGRRTVFQIGLAVFALGSLLCSLAPNIEMLIAARFLQAIGGSMLNPVAMSIITNVFTGKVERARAIGMWGGVVGISMALGPTIGGALIQYVDWRAVFWLNLPVCALALLLTAVFVPQSKSATMRNLDPIGQILGATFLFGIVFVLIEGPGLGWLHPVTLTALVVTVVAFAGFLRFESRRDDPFIDLRFFRSIPFASATAIAVCAFAAWGAFLFMMALYLQGFRGFTPLQTGLLYLPIAVGALIFSPLSGRVVGRFGPRPSLLASGTLLTVAAVLLTFLSVDTPIWAVLVIFAVFGVGFSVVNAPVTNTAVSGMPLDRAGAASAVASTSRQVGVSIGVALCGSVAGAALASPHVDFDDAARPLWFVVIGFGIAIFALGLFSTSERALRSAERVAPLIAGTTEGAGCMPQDDSADDVWKDLLRFVFDNRDTWRHAVVDISGLPFSRIRIIKRLARSPLTVKQVAEHAIMDAPAATVAVNDLEARGLVVREIDPSNRRSKRVSLTDNGRAMVAAIDAVEDPAPEALASLPSDDIATLRRIVDKLTGV